MATHLFNQRSFFSEEQFGPLKEPLPSLSLGIVLLNQVGIQSNEGKLPVVSGSDFFPVPFHKEHRNACPSSGSLRAMWGKEGPTALHGERGMGQPDLTPVQFLLLLRTVPPAGTE